MLTTNMAGAALVFAFVAVGGVLVQVILAVLTVHAARKALRPSAGSKAADRLRAHHLAVLRELLNCLRSTRR